MSRFILTREIAQAAGRDAANCNMRKHKRKEWNREDYDIAWIEFNRLWSLEKDMETRG